jgi:FKBP-type peptidyl-prolyl cis-trans isomerase FklB
MSKSLNSLLFTLLAAVALALPASAQDTPPASSTPSSPAKPAAKAATGQTPATKTPAAKTGTAAKPAPAPLPLKTAKDKASYAIGVSMAKGMKAQGVDIDPAILARGLKDGLAGKSQLTDEEAQAALAELQKNVRAQQEEKAKAASEVNKKEGDAFLSANKAQSGVVALPSGLQYKVLKAGTGPKPTTADTVVCNYRGTLLNGKEFDSSIKRGQPATFPVGQVIPGWTEALQLMPVGSKWQLWIPANLAYGARAAGPDIGPNSTLVFEVELVSIAPKAESKAEPKAEQPKTDQSKSEQPQAEQPKIEQPKAQQPTAQPNKP